MVELTFVILWLGGAVVVGVAAHTRGHVGFGWFVLSLIFTPLLMGLLMLALPNKSEVAMAALAMAREAPREDTHARCPACREQVRRDAVKCRYCGSVLTPQ